MVIDVTTGVPAVLHWGGALDDAGPWGERALTYGTVDVVAPVTLVPCHGDGFPGRPGLLGHRRGGTHWSPRFVSAGHSVSDGVLRASALDGIAGVRLDSEVRLAPDGVMTVAVTVVNVGDTPYMLDGLSVTLPVPADEMVTMHGRWGGEFSTQRIPWPVGAWTAESRFGRTSHENPPYLFACDLGADEWSGRVWGLHLAWSGDHHVYAERLFDDRRHVQMGELFHPGEMCVYPGESHRSPDVIGVFSPRGFTPASWGFHREARRRRPRTFSSRPVHLNSWEAVYFRHEPDRLIALAADAADLGVERFVLDDGWFGSRRDDSSGLGDWEVSTDRYPDGLAPLIDAVVGRGMEFGIWIEPEMVNPDSDLFRTHPDWVLSTPGYEPVMGRRQLVLDLSRPDCFEHVRHAIDRLLRDHDVAYVKWDMNRWLVQASGADGKAASHSQTRAFRRLVDELRARHPRVEFESCASGGGRIDHSVLEVFERVWTSDCNDAHDRQRINRGASMVIPAEVTGAHVGPSPSHQTGRRLSMEFRVATAMFGHFGIEADVTALSDRDREVLRHGIGVHKRFRDLLHRGDAVRFDVDDEVVARGVYASDRSEALLSWARLESGASLVPRNWRMPDLDPDAFYRIDVVSLVPDGEPTAPSRGVVGLAVRQPHWLTECLAGRPVSMSGRRLAVTGLESPVTRPESAVLVHLTRS